MSQSNLGRSCVSSRTSTRRQLLPLCALAVLAYSAGAQAIVVEPDGRLVPQELTEDRTVNCCEVNPDGSNLSLEALFQSRGEAIEWQTGASVEPQYFSPLCGFRGTLILRGGGCKIDFGWYNVDLNSPNPPPANMIYPLVTTADVAAWFTANGMEPNEDNAFHPNVNDPPIQGALIENIRSDPRYWGGFIALATLGNDPNGTCTQTHYSEPRLNQMSIYGQPWIMAVVYMSTVTPNAFYVGFEDLPTAPDNFALPTVPDEYNNDGDFNDFVYFIEGITCEGGGQPCLTSAEGACGFGLTECLPDGTVVCVGQMQPGPETCDNLDNDCNGLVDDDAPCPPGEVCDKGVCRPSCASQEFPCSGDLVCNAAGLCVDPACLDVICEAAQVCVAGQCVGGCDGAVCPVGQQCQLGRCVDPCYARRPDGPAPCPAGMVCEMGVCMETCHCRMCPAAKECDLTSGMCVNVGCIGIACPAGQACQGGVCVDACTNVVCPGGAVCENGWCGEPLASAVDPGDGGSSNPIDPIYLPDGGTSTTEDTGPPPGFLDLCDDSCPTTPGSAQNGVCEDGGSNSVAALCPHGTDCADCGARNFVDTVCSDDCPTAANGQCEDGAPRSIAAACALGTDCTDCGPRWDGSDTPVPVSNSPTTGGPAPADPGCSCRSAGGGRSTPLGSLLLLALGLAGLRRTARRGRAS